MRAAKYLTVIVVSATLTACNAITGINDYGSELTAPPVVDSGPDAPPIDVDTASDGAALETSPTSDSGITPDAPPDSLEPDAAPPPDTMPPPIDTSPTCITHSNGVSGGAGTYSFCAPLGTPGVGSSYSLAMAEAARDSLGASSAGGAGTVCGSSLALACAKTVWGYVTWGYAGPLAGYVYVNPSSCTACPTTLCPTWD